MDRVLIVDDAAENIHMIAQCLKMDYQLLTAKSAVEALAIVNGKNPPDLILLDIEMPQMDGYELCEKLKNVEHSADIPVIFITAKTEWTEEERGLSLGAVDYITKPIQSAIVRARVKTHLMIKAQRDRLRSMAMFDQLTGLYNRHYLIDVAQKKFSKSYRHREPLSLMLLDIDHFKAINDNHGHLVGDKVLKGLAALLKSRFRKEDFTARFGGEEFVVLLDQCGIEQALHKSESVRAEIASTPLANIPVTSSIGVATLKPSDEDFSQLLSRADQALYCAKNEGRNSVRVA